jgi:zinc protease
MNALLLRATAAFTVLGGLSLTALCGCLSHTHADTVTPTDSYAIVASASVVNDVDWNAATIGELLKKYPNAPIITWEKDVSEALPQLKAIKPAFTAFLVKPGEAGVRFTIAVSHLTRNLDDDPYTDTFWGVITGYDADAARSVAAAGPIAVERALDCSGCDLTAFQKAWRYSEDHRGTMNTWDAATDKKIQDHPCDTDNTAGVLERLQQDKIQFLSTSGHATQHDWQMGYCGPNLAMVHKDGELLAVNTKEEVLRANSDEPKIYFANGNCLIGDVDQRDCMALSWMRDGGVKQMMGYTVTTWFGAQGWGTLGLFTDTAGMTTAAEAFHFTNAGIVESLEKTIVETGADDIRRFRLGRIGHVNQPLTRKLLMWFSQFSEKEQYEKRDALRQIVGNLHDRDLVCFYGDPALDARIAKGRLTVEAPSYHPESQTLTLAIRLNKDERKGAVWFRLPGSWTYDRETMDVAEALGEPDLCLDNMIRFPNANLTKKGLYKVVLRKASEMNAPPCAACPQN